MKLNRFGFFDDLPFEERRGALKRLCHLAGPHPDRQFVLKYLETGVPFILIAGITRDWLSDSEEIIGPPHVLTDGKWGWTADVYHYIQRYNLPVPDEFIAHMRSNRWIVPVVADFLNIEI